MYDSCAQFPRFLFSAWLRLRVFWLVSGLHAGACHARAEAACFQEMLLQIFALAIKQKVCLLNQTDRDLGDGLSGAGFRELAEGLKDDFGLSVGTSIMTIFHRSYKSL